MIIPQRKLIERLAEIGEPMTAQTERNRERQGIVPGALRGNSGLPGRSAFYLENSIWENYAAGRFLRGGDYRITSQQLKQVRGIAYEMMSADFNWLEFDTSIMENAMAEYWLALCVFARLGRPVPAVIKILGHGPVIDIRVGIPKLSSGEKIKCRYFETKCNINFDVWKTTEEAEFSFTDFNSGHWINLDDIIPDEIRQLSRGA